MEVGGRRSALSSVEGNGFCVRVRFDKGLEGDASDGDGAVVVVGTEGTA